MAVLGLNLSGHDSAVAVAGEGSLLFAQSEERSTRRKFDGAFPAEALAAALRSLEMKESDIGSIGVSFPNDRRLVSANVARLLRREIRSTRYNLRRPAYWYAEREPMRRAVTDLSERSGSKVRWIGHHRSHSTWALHASGWTDAAVLVIDERGADRASSIWQARHGELRCIESVRYPNSLGLFFSRITSYLGFRANSDEWKVMGLAAYGEPRIDLSSLITIGEGTYQVSGRELVGSRRGDLGFVERVLGPRRYPGEEIEQRHRDVAASAQHAVELAAVALAARATRLTGMTDLCVVGGVALNCKLNAAVADAAVAGRIFVPPAAGDDGAAAGAALALLPPIRGPREPLASAALGSTWEDAEINGLLEAWGVPFQSVEDPDERTAKLLADGLIVARFVGRAEFGPRSLGHRSILANPASVATRDRLNAAIKYRETWRPFAPVVLESAGSRYFEDFVPSRFMARTFVATRLARERAPAVVHHDGTARIQSVDVSDGTGLHGLLSRFESLTETPVLMNTSFNLAGEPVVDSPADAVRTFFSSGLDALVLGRCLLTKR